MMDVDNVMTKRGRPRRHQNNAAKQAAYRRRRDQCERDRLIGLLSKKMLKRISNGYRVELERLTIRKLRELAQVMRKRINRGRRIL